MTVPPQLALAQGRRVRPRKAAVSRPKELELHLAIVLLAPSRRLHALELKQQGEDLTDDQENSPTWCLCHAVQHALARTTDEALTALGCWGALRIKVRGGL